MRIDWRPSLVLLIGVAACAPAIQQSGIMREQRATAMTPAELEFRLHDFTLRYAGVIEETAAGVLAERPEPAVRLAVLRWRLHAVQAFQKPLFQPDPLLAVVDAWLLAEQMIQYYRDGNGRGSLGPFEAPIVDTCRQLRDQLGSLFTGAAGARASKDLDRAWAEQWARAHPLRSHLFVRQSVAPEAAHTLAAGAGVTLGGVLASTQSALDIINVRMTLFVETIPKQIAWQAELAAAEMLIDPATGTITLEHLLPVTQYFERARALADAQMQAAFAQVDRLRIATLDDVRTEREVVLESVGAERQAAFAGVARERQAVLASIAAERAIILEAVQQEILATTTRLREERQAALSQVDGIADDALAATDALARHAIDRLFWRILVLIAAFFLGLIAYRVVIQRLLARRAT